MKKGPRIYWPIQDLFEAAGTDQFTELSIRTGVPARTLHRSSDRGLTDNTADRAAIGLGLHPYTIWPQWFDPYLEGAA
jgi:lambda repressor-like predicted transcriptional regulator